MSYSGVLNYLLVGKESAKGTAVSATKDLGLIRDPTSSMEREVKESMGISNIEAQQITTGMVTFKRGWTMELQHGRILEYALGSVAHAETTGDWKHTFSITDSHPTATLEGGHNSSTDTVWASAGNMLEGLEVSTSLNEVLLAKADWTGITGASSATASTAVVSTLVVFPQALCHVSINGSEATEVQNFSIKITKKVEATGGIASNLAQDINATELHFEFSGQLGFNNKTYQELFLGGTTPSATSDPTAYDILLNAHNGVTLGSGRREFYLELQNCQMKSFEEAASIGNITYVTIGGTGTLKSAFSVDNITSANW